MGFYLRKGFNFGPLRINFSKSGVGLSFGVKGFRVGMGPKGNYVHAGRKGIYYKETLPEIGGEKNGLSLSWPMIVLLIVVIGGIYFYLQADGDLNVMKDLIVKHLTKLS